MLAYATLGSIYPANISLTEQKMVMLVASKWAFYKKNKVTNIEGSVSVYFIYLWSPRQIKYDH